MSFQVFIFVLLACGQNIVLAALALFFSARFSGDVFACYLIMLCAFVATVPTWIALFKRLVGSGWMLVSVISHSTCVVLVCTAIYMGFGLKEATEPLTFGDYLYFSIVTWTTLGYGDLQPVPDLRLLAALQALAGYVSLGLVVSLIISINLSRPPRPGKW